MKCKWRIIWDSSLFSFIFWLHNFTRGGGWLCLGEREIELCHARRKIYQGIVFQTRGSPPGLVYGFVISVAILDFFSPGAHEAGGDGARALLGCCSCSHPFWRPQQGLLQRSDPGDSASFISFGSQLVQAREITYKPSSCRAKALPQEKTKDHWITEVLVGRNSWRSRPSCSSQWEGPYTKPLAGPRSL